MAVNMEVVFTGKKRFLQWIVNELDSGSAKVALFKSNTTITSATVRGDLTEADFSGYSSPNLPDPVVQAAADGSNRAWATVAQVTFAHNGGGTANTIYGFHVWHFATGDLLYAGRLAASKEMASNGDEIKLTLTLTEQTEFDV